MHSAKFLSNVFLRVLVLLRICISTFYVLVVGRLGLDMLLYKEFRALIVGLWFFVWALRVVLLLLIIPYSLYFIFTGETFNQSIKNPPLIISVCVWASIGLCLFSNIFIGALHLEDILDWLKSFEDAGFAQKASGFSLLYIYLLIWSNRFIVLGGLSSLIQE